MTNAAPNQTASSKKNPLTGAIFEDLPAAPIDAPAQGQRAAIFSIHGGQHLREGDTGVTTFHFTIQRSGNETIGATIDWSVQAAAGLTGADFAGGQIPSGRIVFGRGETIKTISIDVAGDFAIEADEVLSVAISTQSPGVLLGNHLASSVIENDDGLSKLRLLPGATHDEGDAGPTAFAFEVLRTGSTLGSASAAWAVTPNFGSTISGADFVGGQLPSGIVTFAPGETKATIVVNVAGDLDVEENESFRIELAAPSPNTTIDANFSSAHGIVKNDDSYAVLWVQAGSTKPEGDSGTTPFAFEVRRIGSTAGPASAHWAIEAAGGSQISGADFAGGQFPSGTVTFAPGETKKTIAVNVAGDLEIEENESFRFVLSNPSANTRIDADFSTSHAIIKNDDNYCTLRLGLSVTKAEGNSGATPFVFEVTRTGSTAAQATAHWTVLQSNNPTLTGADFVGGQLPSGIVTFAPGETKQTIVVNVAGDLTVEDAEMFGVLLSQPSANAHIDHFFDMAFGHILNDDALLGPVSIPPGAGLTIRAEASLLGLSGPRFLDQPAGGGETAPEMDFPALFGSLAPIPEAAFPVPGLGGMGQTIEETAGLAAFGAWQPRPDFLAMTAGNGV